MKKEDRPKKVCKGCELSKGNGDPPSGIIITLDGGWILNHYGGSEGFLGWLALQPRRHVMQLAKLNDDETTALGHNIKLVDKALTDYWSKRFPSDRLERVYIVYFFESVFDEPPTKYHLHLHLIPRTKRLGKNKLGKGKPSHNAAWKIPELSFNAWFPTEYRIKDKTTREDINEEEVGALMTFLKCHLEKRQ